MLEPEAAAAAELLPAAVATREEAEEAAALAEALAEATLVRRVEVRAAGALDWTTAAVLPPDAAPEWLPRAGSAS